MEALLIRLGNDMRQTLHHLLGLLELTAEEPLTAAQSQYLAGCRASADELLRAAADLSELASPEPVTQSPTLFRSADAIAELIGVMRILAGNKDLELLWSLDPEVPEEVFADKDLIQDILRRLLDNSIRFTSYGRLSLAVKASVLEADRAVLMFEIADTGPGMPAEILAAQCNWPDAPFGAGLGLAIVRKRLAVAKGHFEIVNSTSEGTVIRMTLPVCYASAGTAGFPEQRPERTASPNACSPLKLLVVEDSDDSFALFQAYVKGQGHWVSRAVNGAIAVGMVKSGDYDLVVMDVNMPVMDGYAATQTIREWETEGGRTRMPILLLSAEEADRQMRHGALVGCSGYLTKPTRKRELLKALDYFGQRPTAS